MWRLIKKGEWIKVLVKIKKKVTNGDTHSSQPQGQFDTSNIVTGQTLIFTSLKNINICLKEFMVASTSFLLNGDHISAKKEKIETWMWKKIFLCINRRYTFSTQTATVHELTTHYSSPTPERVKDTYMQMRSLHFSLSWMISF